VTGRGAALAAALAAGLCGTAQATVPFPRADANGDGYVTYPEARRVMRRLAEIHFRKCDPNGDGLIDAGEYPLLDNFYWLNYVGS
jgi:hypothetical protein